MSDDNSDSAPNSDPRGTGGGAGEETAPRALSGSGENGASPTGIQGPRGLSRQRPGTQPDDTDALSSGNDSGERESEGRMERQSGSRGRQSTCSSQSSSSHNGKDSGLMLETTESNKR